MLEKEWDRVAREKEYFEEVISPFDDKNSARLIQEEIKKGGSVIELGCGLGKLLPFLKRNFKTVYAVDFSQNMIDFAKNKNEKVVFEKRDLRKLKYKNKFDAAVAINSVISPSIKEVNKILKNIHDLLSRNGRFIGVFPSLESILYIAMLVYEKKRRSYPKKIAKEKTRAIIESREYDFLLGFLKEKGGEQKHFYEFELEYRLKKAGFRNIMIKKLPYPWKILEDRERYFPKEEPIWDWLVTASK